MDYDPKHGPYDERNGYWPGYPDAVDMVWFTDRNPSLSLGGMDILEPEPLDYLEIRRVLWWLIDARKSASPKGKWRWWNSYYLKHVAEQALGLYVTNGTFIAAAFLAGVKHRKTSSGPNVGFFLPDLKLAQPWTDQDGVDAKWRQTVL